MGEREDCERLIMDLVQADRNDDQVFRQLIRDAEHTLRLKPDDFSNMFSISHPSVNRWKTGRSSPHPVMRRAIFGLLAKRALEHLRRIS